MKVAILTLPFHANYGGVLQAFALQTVLQRLGHEVIVLDKDMFYHRSWLRQQVATGAYLVRKYLFRQHTDNVNLRRMDYEKKMFEKDIRKFINTHLNIVQVRDLPHEFPRDIEAVVVGSDQVWRPKYFSWSYGCGIENAFLSFLKYSPVKRISYAASFGTGAWEYSEEETRICSQLLNLFDAVSVREASGVTLCREQLGREDVVQMPDPTLLLSKKDYLNLFKTKKSSFHYLLYYVLDETDDTWLQAAHIAEERGLMIKKINDASPYYSPFVKTSVEEWLRGIAESDFVFTDSFHACVFSIIFEKPFKTIGNQTRGMDRFESLLSIFGQDNYHMVLEEQKNQALSFLSHALNGQES